MAHRSKKKTATFLGANKGLSIIGDHCGAYSGRVTFDDNVTDALNFTTGTGTTVLDVMICTDNNDVDKFQYAILFNNTTIAKALFLDTTQTDLTLPIQLMNLVIPPNTTVQLTFQNLDDTSEHQAYGIMTGRVYDA